MFANALRQTLAVLGLVEETPSASEPTIADLNLDRPAEAFEALRRIASQTPQTFDLAA